MRITLKLYATLTDYLPPAARAGNLVELEVASGSTIPEVIAPYNLPHKLVHLLLVNGVFITPDSRATHVLVDGDVLAIWPPIAGG
jgi:sulfur carrier protein ThiS